MPFKFHPSTEQKEKLAQKVANKVQSQDTPSQIRYLASALDRGLISKSKLREALDRGCRREMAKGVERIKLRGVPLTADALLEAYYADKEFIKLADRVGLTEDWFINLAKAVASG